MGRKNKLKKFAEIVTFPNVFESYQVRQPQLVGMDMQPIDLRGKWKSEYFKNTNSITLELACGKGEYTLALARLYPDRNFIGVDVKGNRLWQGAKTALEEHLGNVAFLRTHIEVIDHFFAPDEVDEIWITFPDPFPRKGQENRRLTSSHYYEKYRRFLRQGGWMHLKHDDPDFFAYSREVVETDTHCTLLYAHTDIYSEPLAYPELAIRTYYESKHLLNGKTIKYMRYLIH